MVKHHNQEQGKYSKMSTNLIFKREYHYYSLLFQTKPKALIVFVPYSSIEL